MPVSHGHDSGKVGIKVTSAGARTGMGLIQDAHNCGGRACRQGVMARFAIGCLELLMEMQQVRYFVALAGTLNFTRAAARCNVSQPAHRRAITQSEERLEGKEGGS